MALNFLFCFVLFGEKTFTPATMVGGKGLKERQCTRGHQKRIQKVR